MFGNIKFKLNPSGLFLVYKVNLVIAIQLQNNQISQQKFLQEFPAISKLIRVTRLLNELQSEQILSIMVNRLEVKI